MHDNIPPEVGLTIGIILWALVAWPFARTAILGKRNKK